MAITPSSGTQNGVTAWFTLSDSTVTVEVSSTYYYWRINGTNSGGDHGTYYIEENNNDTGSFIAEDGHSYAFQVARNGAYSNGLIFTVYLGSDGDNSGDGGESGSVSTSCWADDIYFGDNCRVTWTPLSSSTTYRLEFSLGNYVAKTSPFTPGTTDRYTYTDFDIPLSAATNIPNDTSGVMYVSIIPYSDSSGRYESGTRLTTHFKIKLGSSVIPEILSCEAVLDNSSNPVLDGWGVALAKHSRVGLLATASGTHGSTIVSYAISGDYNLAVTASGDEKELDYTGPIINSYGQKAFNITCTDSRGRTSKACTTNLIQFLPYVEPNIKSLSISKDTKGDSDQSNDKMVATATWSHDSIDNHNSSSGLIYYRATTSSTWTLHSGELVSGTPFTLEELTLEEYSSYNFRVVVTDAIGTSARKEAFSSTNPVLLDFKAGGDGLGIGKVCEAPGLEISMDSTFWGDIYIGNKETTLRDYISSISPTFDMIYPIGSIYMSVIGTNPEVLFGGSWTQLPGRFLLGAGASESNTTDAYGSVGVGELDRPAGERGGEVTHTLTVDEMPKHKHGGVRRYNDDEPGTSSTGASAGDGSADIETDSAGGNQPHNNIPPYLAVYMWKRVA